MVGVIQCFNDFRLRRRDIRPKTRKLYQIALHVSETFLVVAVYVR